MRQYNDDITRNGEYGMNKEARDEFVKILKTSKCISEAEQRVYKYLKNKGEIK